MASDYKRVHPKDYYRKFLSEGVRPDGRALRETLPMMINIDSVSTAEGSALVRLGGTCVLCGIKAELAQPSVNHPDRGYLVPNVELPALCSSKFRPGPPSEEAQVLSQWLNDVVESSATLPLEQLCIASGQFCWVLYADLTCLNYDGSLPDACLAALLAALRTVRLPEVRVDEEEEKVVRTGGTSPALSLKCHPTALSFAIFDDSIIVANPNGEEESLATGLFQIAVTDSGTLCGVHKAGGSPLEQASMLDYLQQAVTHADTVRQFVDKAVQSL